MGKVLWPVLDYDIDLEVICSSRGSGYFGFLKAVKKVWGSLVDGSYSTHKTVGKDVLSTGGVYECSCIYFYWFRYDSLSRILNSNCFNFLSVDELVLLSYLVSYSGVKVNGNWDWNVVRDPWFWYTFGYEVEHGNITEKND